MTDTDKSILVSQAKVNMLASSMVDHGFKPWSVKPNTLNEVSQVTAV
jgi:hypothetical protein